MYWELIVKWEMNLRKVTQKPLTQKALDFFAWRLNSDAFWSAVRPLSIWHPQLESSFPNFHSGRQIHGLRGLPHELYKHQIAAFLFRSVTIRTKYDEKLIKISYLAQQLQKIQWNLLYFIRDRGVIRHLANFDCPVVSAIEWKDEGEPHSLVMTRSGEPVYTATSWIKYPNPPTVGKVRYVSQ